MDRKGNKDTLEPQLGQWGDVFPQIRNSATSDPRIFQTPWTKVKHEGQDFKKKTFFACVVGKDCYGVDVIRPWAKEDPTSIKNAMAKMKRACYYYEHNGEWPKA